MKSQTCKSFFSIAKSIIIGILIVFTTSCEDYMQGKVFQPADQKMIDEYAESDTSMHEFLKIIDQVGYRGLLHAYGTNTCFIPVNSAIYEYAKELGVDSLQQLSDEELVKFLDFHIIRDTIQSADFIDGRLPRATMLGKFLTTKMVQFGNSTPTIQVSRQANVLEKDIRTGNGIIHKIDHVLIPNSKTVGEMIRELPDSYSLFKSIMVESHLIDTLTNNKASGQWYTVLLQSDESFAKVGVTELDSLISKMKVAQPDLANDREALIDMYASYHVINRLAYVADLSLSSSELTLAKNQVLTIRSNKDSVIVNEYRTLTNFEAGVTIDKNSYWTDFSCYNGVLIDLTESIHPVKRGAAAVYWEISDQPEIKALKEYRKIGAAVTFTPGQLSELNFGGSNNPKIIYKVDAYSINSQYVHGDYLEISTLRPSVMQWMEIKTPVLTEGVYYVWICWRRGGNNNKFKTTFKQEGKEDQVLPNVFDLGEYFAKTTSPEVNLNNGAKQYNAKYINSVVCSRNCGAIRVDFTGRHTLRIDALSGGSQAAWWDMVQFIPIDQNQLWPKFDYAGNAVYPCTPGESIFPYDQPFAFYNNDPCQ